MGEVITIGLDIAKSENGGAKVCHGSAGIVPVRAV
jgi:hypothetical protein